MLRGLLNSEHPFMRGITLERLESEHSVRLNVSEPGTPFRPFVEGGFETPSGRCEFGAECFDYQPPVESRLGDSELRARFPLELVSSKNDDSMNSTFGYRAAVDEQTSKLVMHRADAVERGIEDGDLVRVFNERGSLALTASVDGGVREGVVRAPSVRWAKSSPGKRSVNALTSDRLADMGGGPAFYSCLVQVERCGD